MNTVLSHRAGLAPSGLALRPVAVRVKTCSPARTVSTSVPLQSTEVCRKSVCCAAAASDAVQEDPFEKAAGKLFGKENAASVVTVTFIACWYALNIGFNLCNKSLLVVFKFPWFVSAIHVVVGALYCVLAYLVGARAASFERPITKDEFMKILGPASMHAIGHVAANLSFAAVAISLTHTIKTLEPAFNVILGKLILGTVTPLPVMAALLPIMVGVAMASAAELSFNWLGFLTAMMSNLTFGFRAVWAKKAMADIKNLGSTGVYAYTTLISVFICVPGAFIFEGGRLQAGIEAAVANIGATNFYGQLITVGLLYHLYNQFAFNTLQRVTPVSHGVCNVIKRICIIGASVVFFGNTLSTQTKVGTGIALAGTWLYTEMTKREKLKAAGAA